MSGRTRGRQMGQSRVVLCPAEETLVTWPTRRGCPPVTSERQRSPTGNFQGAVSADRGAGGAVVVVDHPAQPGGGPHRDGLAFEAVVPGAGGGAGLGFADLLASVQVQR